MSFFQYPAGGGKGIIEEQKLTRGRMFILTTDILAWKEVGRCVQFARSEVTLAKFLFKLFKTISCKDGIYTYVKECTTGIKPENVAVRDSALSQSPSSTQSPAPTHTRSQSPDY